MKLPITFRNGKVEIQAELRVVDEIVISHRTVLVPSSTIYSFSLSHSILKPTNMFKICLHSCVAKCRCGVGTGLQMNLRFKDTDRLAVP